MHKSSQSLKKGVLQIPTLVLLLASISSLVFFCLLQINAYIVKSDFVLIGVVLELFFIPTLLAIPVLFILGTYRFYLDRFFIIKTGFWIMLIAALAFTQSWFSFFTSDEKDLSIVWWVYQTFLE